MQDLLQKNGVRMWFEVLVVRAVLAALVLCAGLSAQTQFRLDMMQTPTGQTGTGTLWVPLVYFAPGATTARLVYYQLDASFVVDAGTNKLRVAAPVSIVERVESLVAGGTPSQTWTLAAVPASVPQVTLNGLVMTEGIDYQRSGRVVTFVAAQAVHSGDILQARYRE